MTFDNGKTIIRLRLRVFIFSVVLIVWFYLTYFENKLNFPILGLGEIAWTSAILFLYFTISFYPLLFSYKYIYFSDDGPRIIFRYYSVGLFRGKSNSVEIPKRDFAGFKKGSSAMGLIGFLLLKQRIDKRIAQYPPVHISSLSRKELSMIIKVLESYEN